MKFNPVNLVLLFSILLSSCGSGKPATGTPGASPLPKPTSIPTAAPSPTPGSPRVVLVIPADLNETQSKNYQKAVYDLATAQKYRFVVYNKLSDADLDSSLKIVIDLSPDTDINALAAKAPQTQFLAINLPTVKPGGNVSVLGGQSISIDKIAFMAGYIGAAISQDFHTGLLFRKGSPDEDTLTAAMHAGQQFFCGLCNPVVAPYNDYPLAQFIPDDAKPAEYAAYADILIHKQVDTIFLEPGVDIPELVQYLQTVGVLMIGTKTPIPPVNGWLVTLQPNYLKAMQTAFPDLVAGKGGKTFPAPLSFNDTNNDLFSPGKQADAQKVLDELLSGLITTIQK